LRQRRADIEDIADIASEAVVVINELIMRYKDDDNLASELEVLRRYATILQEKPAKLAKLRDFRGYKFAVVDETTGDVRTATHDEALRLIMDYKHGSVIDIYRNWTVVDGEWVRRPKDNPTPQDEE